MPTEHLWIPRTFHRIWLGPAPMPQQFVEWGRQWLELHPGWEMKQWGDAQAATLEMQNRASFYSAPTWAGKSDILRLEVLNRFGGVYIDTDFEPLKNIEPYLWSAQAFVAWQDTHLINNAIMGAVPHHPYLEAMLRDVPGGMAGWNDVFLQVGPGLLTRTLQAGSFPDVLQFDPGLFYPYSWNELERENEEFPDAIAVHHWAMSWKAESKGSIHEIEVPLKASVIIPTSGDLSRLSFVLSGLSSQSERAFETLVVDDASDHADQTRALCERFGVRYLFVPLGESEHKPRPSLCRNMGALHARAPVVLFGDQDCFAEHDWVSAHISTTQSKRVVFNIRKRLSQALFESIENEPLQTVSWRWLLTNSTWEDAIDRRGGSNNSPASECWSHGLSMLRAEFLSMGGFDLRFDGVWGGEDTDLSIRCERAGFSLYKLATCALQIHLDHEQLPQQDNGDSLLHDLACDPSNPVVANGGPLRFDSKAALGTGLDLFERTKVPFLDSLHETKPERAKRFCIATLCSQDEPNLVLLDDWLGSIIDRGELQEDSRIAVFSIQDDCGKSEGVRGVIEAHRQANLAIRWPEIIVVPVEALTKLGCNVKALFYSVHRWLPDATILAMDCDTLILASLRPLLEAAEQVENLLIPSAPGRQMMRICDLLTWYASQENIDTITGALDASHPVLRSDMSGGNSGVLVAQRSVWQKLELAFKSWKHAWAPVNAASVERNDPHDPLEEALLMATSDAFHLRCAAGWKWNFALWNEDIIARVSVQGEGKAFRAFNGKTEIAVLHFAGKAKWTCSQWRGHFTAQSKTAVAPALPASASKALYKCRACGVETNCGNCIAPNTLAVETLRSGRKSCLCQMCDAARRGLPEDSVPLDIRLSLEQKRREQGISL